MKQKRLRPQIVIAFIIICSIGVLYYSYKVVTWNLNVEENNKIQDKLNNNIKKDNNDKYIIDFKQLKKQNPDTKAHIKVNNTNIDYIVVQGKNNSYYLNHNYDKKWNIAGWIFLDYRNKIDETDKNLIIYGHNMKDGSMFDSLKETLNKSWYENTNNHIIYLTTEKDTYYYQVFSTYSIKPEDYYLTTSFNTNKSYLQFLKKLQSRSIYNYNVKISEEDKILTLSSCLGDGRKRVVLHAKLLDKKEY